MTITNVEAGIGHILLSPATYGIMEGLGRPAVLPFLKLRLTALQYLCLEAEHANKDTTVPVADYIYDLVAELEALVADITLEAEALAKENARPRGRPPISEGGAQYKNDMLVARMMAGLEAAFPNRKLSSAGFIRMALREGIINDENGQAGSQESQIIRRIRDKIKAIPPDEVELSRKIALEAFGKAR